ncbi:MAG: glycoside hydrolase family 16 protein [Patescibacteria group bacterium]
MFTVYSTSFSGIQTETRSRAEEVAVQEEIVEPKQPVGQTSGWLLVFADEFAGTTLDTANWSTGWFGTGITKPANVAETAAYDPEQVRVTDGNLNLTTVTNSVTIEGKTYPYRTGVINSNGKKHFTHGYYEARIFLPAAENQVANWPAWWMTGQNWPTDGEIDILEGLGGKASWHFHSSQGAPGGDAPGDYTGWHTFAADWKADSIVYYYDGEKVGEVASGVTSSPLYLILGNQIGSWGGPLLVPSTMQVDYVRVWEQVPDTEEENRNTIIESEKPEEIEDYFEVIGDCEKNDTCPKQASGSSDATNEVAQELSEITQKLQDPDSTDEEVKGLLTRVITLLQDLNSNEEGDRKESDQRQTKKTEQKPRVEKGLANRCVEAVSGYVTPQER